MSYFIINTYIYFELIVCFVLFFSNIYVCPISVNTYIFQALQKGRNHFSTVPTDNQKSLEVGIIQFIFDNFLLINKFIKYYM